MQIPVGLEPHPELGRRLEQTSQPECRISRDAALTQHDLVQPIERDVEPTRRLYLPRYGFADAFHPADGWVNPDVIGIDVGITLLSAENLRTGRVWTWFMQNTEIPGAMQRAGLVH